MKKMNILIFLLILSIVIAVMFIAFYGRINNVEEESTLSLVLKGELEYNIIKGNVYDEPGYIAYDTLEGDLTDKVIVVGSVDYNTIGTYKLIYLVSNTKKKIIEKERTINVILDLTDLKFEYNYSPKEITKDEVLLKVYINGDGYDFLEDFRGILSKVNEIEYKIEKNGKYVFKIMRKDGQVIEEVVEINNIDQQKPTGSCINTITNGKSEITVTANDENGIKGYDYIVNGKVQKSTNEAVYQYNKLTSNAKVVVYDEVGNDLEISCPVTYNVDQWPKDKTRDMISTNNNYYYEGKYGNNNYILYYPNTINLEEKNPLVIYLGGGGEIGSNINLIRSTNFGSNMKKGIFQGAVYLLPQCRSGWEYCFTSLKSLIDETVQKYNVDSTRISIMGHSHGAVSTYQMIALYPGFFSSAAVLSGHYEKKVTPDSLKGIKIIAYYGEKDSNIVAGRIRTKYLIEQGVNLKYVELANEAHTIQNRVINYTDTIEWLIAQKRN